MISERLVNKERLVLVEGEWKRYYWSEDVESAFNWCEKMLEKKLRHIQDNPERYSGHKGGFKHGIECAIAHLRNAFEDISHKKARMKEGRR